MKPKIVSLMKKSFAFLRKLIKFGGKHFIIPFMASILALTCFVHGSLFYLESNHKCEQADTALIVKTYIKNSLVEEVDSYIHRYAPKSKMSADSIVTKCLEKDYDISLLLAQAHIESHFGTKGRATKTNSVFGIGAWDNGEDKHSYVSPNAAIDHYINHMINYYLKDNPPLEVLENGLTRNGYRYASDINYEKKIINKIKLINQNYHIYKLQNLYVEVEND